MSYSVACSVCGSSFKSEQINGGICPECSQSSSSPPTITKRSKDQIQTDIKRIQQQAWENYNKKEKK